jgi:hypothetical protein
VVKAAMFGKFRSVLVFIETSCLKSLPLKFLTKQVGYNHYQCSTQKDLKVVKQNLCILELYCRKDPTFFEKAEQIGLNEMFLWHNATH